MNVGDLLRVIFHQDVPPTPKIVNVPDESAIIWAKSKTEANKRRARELQIDVDFDKRLQK